MNQEQLLRMSQDPGFIAALDQSGGSTPKALASYGILEDAYTNKDEMFDLVHAMRTRIITSESFDARYILGAILFEQTMDRKIEDLFTADYLWNRKQVIPFLKVDKGLEEIKDGVQLMKPIDDLEDLLQRAKNRNIFGTKMRSVIHEANREGIRAIVQQQFNIGQQIIDAGLVPILEPEVNIQAQDKELIEQMLLDEIMKVLKNHDPNHKLMFKITLPSLNNLYEPLIQHPAVVRVVALSGGYSRELANQLLAENNGLIASFSRALSEGLRVDQSPELFDQLLGEAVFSIYQASMDKQPPTSDQSYPVHP